MSLNGNPFAWWRPGPPLSRRDKLALSAYALGLLAFATFILWSLV